MNNFFCGLHYMVGLAKSVDETIKSWEESILEERFCDGQYTTRSSSGTQRLIRSACKAFHHHGSPFGSSHLFGTYLQERNILKIPLA